MGIRVAIWKIWEAIVCECTNRVLNKVSVTFQVIASLSRIKWEEEVQKKSISTLLHNLLWVNIILIVIAISADQPTNVLEFVITVNHQFFVESHLNSCITIYDLLYLHRDDAEYISSCSTGFRANCYIFQQYFECQTCGFIVLLMHKLELLNLKLNYVITLLK